MKKLGWLAVLGLGLCLNSAHATGWRKDNSDLALVNFMLRGKVIDHTANHGKDNRIWSRTLGERRDLYVYMPPGFDARQRYPIMIFLHGNTQDEQIFLEVVKWIDKAIVNGELPPLIVAAPDGTVSGEPTHHKPATFFLNSNQGDYEDYLLNDVWDFVVTHYPIRPERGAHVLTGFSMGGFAAFNLGIRHRYAFGVVAGFYPPLNVRWMDTEGNYRADFDPAKWGWRTSLHRSHEVAGRFAFGLVPIRINDFIDPLFGNDDTAMAQVSCHNPIELIDRTRLRNCELEMFVAWGCKDELNIDAQVESFLYLADFRGIAVGRSHDPEGRHDMKTAFRLFPGFVEWLAPRLAPFSPGGEVVCQKPAPRPPSPRPMGPRPEIPRAEEPAHVTRKQPLPPGQEPVLRWMDREKETPAAAEKPGTPAPRTPVPPALTPLEAGPIPVRRDLGEYAGPPVGGSPFASPPAAVTPTPALPRPPE